MSAAWDLAASARMVELQDERDRALVQLALSKAALDEVTDRLELTRLERDNWKDAAHKLNETIQRLKLAAMTPDADEEPNR